MHLLFYLLLLCSFSQTHSSPTELELLMQIKASLDPQTDPCSGSFEGVACNELGHVANISLQGKGLLGQIPAALGGLKSLTGLYLHFNALNGVIPKEIAELSELSDLYLNVNNLSGEIPPQIGNLSNLQVLQLCYNKLTGSVPTQLGSLEKLSVLALQYNQLTGAIPASLGDLELLSRLDLSFNGLFGPIPVKLAKAPLLQALDIRNNNLSGNIPPALKRLTTGFQYGNNSDLCGVGFSNLEKCAASDPDRPEPSEPNVTTAKDIPESANPSDCSKSDCSNPSKTPRYGIIFGVIGVFIAVSVTGILMFSWHRRSKQKIGSALIIWMAGLALTKYSNGWDPLAIGRSKSGFSQEVLESFMFNLEEVERATQCFSEMNLLGKSNFSAIYKGILRDGSVVAIKSITKTSCKSDEADFLKGLKILTSLKHENLLRLRGFCCSKGRGECFLIYDFVPNGNLVQYLDVKDGSGKVLEWTTRISIINGIAKGQPAQLLADDVVFSMLKASAAMGYLAPEYTTTGRFTEKSDIYAFGMIVLQILSGKRNITQLTHHAAESCRKLLRIRGSQAWKIALCCTNESPNHRPTMEAVMQELGESTVANNLLETTVFCPIFKQKEVLDPTLTTT
ncbi:LRR receptor serine/threonine-protein kinase [Salix suchowensis]|nr:LRR receptor serine/threonine-protein kinase [Salix suchowensis]